MKINRLGKKKLKGIFPSMGKLRHREAGAAPRVGPLLLAISSTRNNKKFTKPSVLSQR